MAKPKLNKKGVVTETAFPFGSLELVYSELLGQWVYAGIVQIPRVIGESRIRVREAFQRSEDSPDYTIDVLEIKDGKPDWVEGAGCAWWRTKDDVDRISLLLNIGTGGKSVDCAAFEAENQPEKDAIPEGYSEDMGPLLWRISYKPMRASGGKPSGARTDAAPIADEIKY